MDREIPPALRRAAEDWFGSITASERAEMDDLVRQAKAWDAIEPHRREQVQLFVIRGGKA